MDHSFYDPSERQQGRRKMRQQKERRRQKSRRKAQAIKSPTLGDLYPDLAKLKSKP